MRDFEDLMLDDEDREMRVSGVMRSIVPSVPTSRGAIVGAHESMRSLLATLARVAPSSCTVLVTGESGTGKELIVAALHDQSPRRDKPMVTVNCGAIPENLLESELFGHAKGAFTGAHAARSGRVAAAEGGTLFLDEIGEMPMQLQVKLLRLLQQREYSPVGETRVLKCNIRVVAATNRDLDAEVAAGRFREDLFYRLNVVHLQVPALRDRGSDVEILAKHFFRECAERSGRTDLLGLSDAAVEAIRAYDWPGNIRALENVMERAVLLAIGPRVEAHDLPAKVRGGSAPASAPNVLPDGGIDLRAAIEAYENTLIKKALERTGWNKARAAELLGINRTTLVEMVKRKHLVA